jgi:hypothetical protein
MADLHDLPRHAELVPLRVLAWVRGLAREGHELARGLGQR